jgi:hypothetical protein
VLHDRLPVGVGHFGDEHLAGPELFQVGRRSDDARRTLTDLLPHAAALRQHLTRALEDEPLEHQRVPLRVDGFRPRLQQVELPGESVLRPLHVHRCGRAAQPRVVLLDQHGPSPERQDLVVCEDKALAIVPRDRHAAGLPCAAFLVDQLELLGSERLLQDRAEAGGERRLEDRELIRVDRALHDALAQPVGAVDEHGIAKACFGVDREHHTGAGQVRAHHLLHADREGDLRMVEAAMRAIDDRAVGEERGVAALHRVEQHRFAVDVEEYFLLAGEAGLGQVLRCGAAPDGDIAVGTVLGLELAVGVRDGPGEPIGQRGGENRGSQAGAGGLQPGDVGHVEVHKSVGNHTLETAMVRWPAVTAGQNLRISQAGCLYAVSQDAISIAAAGGPGRFDVLQMAQPLTCGGPLQDACVWTATSNVRKHELDEPERVTWVGTLPETERPTSEQRDVLGGRRERLRVVSRAAHDLHILPVQVVEVSCEDRQDLVPEDRPWYVPVGPEHEMPHLLDHDGCLGAQRAAHDGAHVERRQAARRRAPRPQVEHGDVHGDERLGAEIGQPPETLERQLDLSRAPRERNVECRLGSLADHPIGGQSMSHLKPLHRVHQWSVVQCAGHRRGYSVGQSPRAFRPHSRCQARIRPVERTSRWYCAASEWRAIRWPSSRVCSAPRSS